MRGSVVADIDPAHRVVDRDPLSGIGTFGRAFEQPIEMFGVDPRPAGDGAAGCRSARGRPASSGSRAQRARIG